MKLKQISIPLENAHGRLYEVTHALGKAGINLRALNHVDTGAFGQLRLLVSDVATTRRILMEMRMPARIDEVVAAEIGDKPGELSRLLKCLYDTSVNVLYTYAFTRFSSDKAVLIFRFNDNDQAIEILQKNSFTILDAKAFGILSSVNK